MNDRLLGSCLGAVKEGYSHGRMKPGDGHFYDVGVVHSPKRDGLTKLVRIEGSNLDRIKRSNIKAADAASKAA